MARVLHLLPHPGGGGERNHRLIAEGLRSYTHEYATWSRRQDLPWAAPDLLLRRRGVARRISHADLIHVDGDAASVLSSRVTHPRPVVITTAGLHLLRRSRSLQPLVKRCIRHRVLTSKVTICTSEAERRELETLCGPDAPLRVVYNGVPVPALPTEDQRESARSALGVSDEEVVALMVARLEGRKHPLTAARAARSVRGRGVPLVLFIAGEGPLYRRLNKLAGPAVRPLGFRDDIQDLMAGSDFFVLPSEREGLSLGLLEAMAAGLPAVVGDGPGNPEAVGGDAGMLVPPGDSRALADALETIATNTALRKTAATAARARVERYFSLERMLEGIDSAYADALA